MRSISFIGVILVFVSPLCIAQQTFNTEKIILQSPNEIGLYQSNSTSGVWASGMVWGDRWGVYEDATSAKERLSILSGGNVGIGTATPSATLHVMGNIKSSSRINGNEYISVDKGGSYRVAMNGQGDGYISGRNDNVEQKFLISSKGVSFFNGGNVLINKTSQANYTYILDVNGKIRANEIVVNTTGADFVFESDYDLPKLEFVEQYIKENNHLPEIPSAAVMQEEGMSVGELNTKLLQKVEELTLYLIEQNEVNKSQANEIAELKKMVQCLVNEK